MVLVVGGLIRYLDCVLLENIRGTLGERFLFRHTRGMTNEFNNWWRLDHSALSFLPQERNPLFTRQMSHQEHFSFY